MIKIYKKYEELKKKLELDLLEKDYICNVLDDIPIYKESRLHSFYLIPKEKNITYFQMKKNLKMFL